MFSFFLGTQSYAAASAGAEQVRFCRASPAGQTQDTFYCGTEAFMTLEQWSVRHRQKLLLELPPRGAIWTPDAPSALMISRTRPRPRCHDRIALCVDELTSFARWTRCALTKSKQCNLSAQIPLPRCRSIRISPNMRDISMLALIHGRLHDLG